MNAKYPRHSRLSGSKDYKRLFKHASRIRGHYLTLLYCPNTLHHARLGFAISNKHAGSVVRKNKIKRRIREYFRSQLKDITLDLVVLSKPGIHQADRQQIESNLRYFKRKLNERSLPKQ